MYVWIVYKTTHTVLKTVPATFLLTKNNLIISSQQESDRNLLLLPVKIELQIVSTYHSLNFNFLWLLTLIVNTNFVAEGKAISESNY